MLSTELLRELRTAWLPNIPNRALDRLIELLERDSPLLVHGCFARAVPMGCLATQIAWHHCETEHLTVDAGVQWVTRVAGLNPATSHVIRAWDEAGPNGWQIRAELLATLREERRTRNRLVASEQPEVLEAVEA